MTNSRTINAEQSQNEASKRRVYDLAERTACFAEQVIRFVRRLPRDRVLLPLTTQLIRSGTSIGANYCEADNACSRKDFKHRLTICRKEARETKYWLRLMMTAVPECKEEASAALREATELHLIFAKIIRSTDSRSANESS